jgi:flagellar biosynthesis protein
MSKKNNSSVKAIALSYDENIHSEPKVIAKGIGNVAHNIVDTAKSHNIPIKEDSNLVELLSKLQINESIPEELYLAVAEIFAFIYQVDKNLETK